MRYERHLYNLYDENGVKVLDSVKSGEICKFIGRKLSPSNYVDGRMKIDRKYRIEYAYSDNVNYSEYEAYIDASNTYQKHTPPNERITFDMWQEWLNVTADIRKVIEGAKHDQNNKAAVRF